MESLIISLGKIIITIVAVLPAVTSFFLLVL